MPTSLLVRKGLSNGSVVSAILFVMIFAIYASTGENVFTAFSMNNLIVNMTAQAIAATGLTLIILSGGFDLSVGGVVVLANVILASSHAVTASDVFVSIGLVLAASIVVGVINGFFIAYVGVQSIAVTLATMIMCQGIALVVMPAPGGNVSPIITSLTKPVGVIPGAAIVLLLLVVLWLLYRRTSYGVYIYAIGEDEKAAFQAGIPVRRVKFFIYVKASLIYGLAGVMLSAQTASGDPTGSSLFLLLVFAAVAIGGTKFGGGRGSVIGSMIGAGILALLQKTLFAVGVATFYTSIFQGLVLIVAVLIGSLSIRLAKRGEV